MQCGIIICLGIAINVFINKIIDTQLFSFEKKLIHFKTNSDIEGKYNGLKTVTKDMFFAM